MSSTEPAIRIFYHITCINNWRTIVREQFLKLIFSGLYHRATSIHCFMVIPKYDRSNDCKTFVQRFGNKIVVEDTVGLHEPAGTNEWFTLNQIKKFIQQPTDRILYLHSKGITRCDHPAIYPNVEDWRDVMDYHLIFRHEACLDALQRHSAVGVNYLGDPPHFSGNYWWCTGKHYLQLPDNPEIASREGSAEAYVMLSTEEGTSNIAIFQSPIAGGASYHQPYPFKEYIDAQK